MQNRTRSVIAAMLLVVSYGEFQLFAGGDITWNVEHHLACPKNIVGEVDVFQVTHHGLDASNNPILLEALNPTVCIAMNGPRKGIQPNAFRALKEVGVRIYLGAEGTVREAVESLKKGLYEEAKTQDVEGEWI